MNTVRWMILALAGAGLVALALVWAPAGPAAHAQGDPGATPPPEFPGQNLPPDRGTYFTAAGGCTNCHTNMQDANGSDVSIDAFWRSTMMANAARDPYWQASVRVETLEVPHLAGVIEDKCATCHLPMARFTLAQQDEQGLVLDDAGLTNPSDPLHALGMDGVSCTLCHQIEPDGLGTEASFSGGYIIDPALPMGERAAYSRFEVAPELSAMMAGASGFVPLQGLHTIEPEVCASCHTLYTPYVDAAGEIAGTFPEQMPYFEWQHSVYSQTIGCQGCHMPRAIGAVQTSITGGPPREPFSMHEFVGGNAYLPRIFRAFGEDMAVTAGSQHFDATYQRALNRLTRLTATLAIKNIALEGDTLAADVILTSSTGHKFPTGFPSRRAWLHVTVQDASGAVVFESGAFDTDGRVLGDDHDADPAAYEPHHTTITSPDQVQIYETVMADMDGNITTTLLRGAGYVKDNRVLPMGFDKTTAEPHFAVYGAALEDTDFVGGSDCVRYQVDVSGAEGPFTILAEVRYLSISYNWVEKLRPYDTVESAAFLSYVAGVPNEPVLVASATATAGE